MTKYHIIIENIIPNDKLHEIGVHLNSDAYPFPSQGTHELEFIDDHINYLNVL